MTKYSLLLTVIVLLGSSVATAEEAWVNDRLLIQVRAWSADFDAETSIVKHWFGGKLDLDEELDLDDELTPEITLRWQFNRRNALQLRYNYLSFDGSEFLVRGVVLDHQAIPLFARLEADADMHFLRLDWRREWFADKSDAFDFETSFGILGFDLQGSYEAYIPGFGWLGGLGPFSSGIWQTLLDVTLPDYLDFLNTALYQDDEESITAALPVLGAGIEWRPTNRLSFNVDVSGMYAGDYGEFFDAEASVGFAVTRWFELNGGFRYWRIDVDDGDDDYRVIMSGPFVGGTIRF